MNTYHQIEITMNREQAGYEKNRHQIVKWLLAVIPMIAEEQKPATEIMYIKTLNQIAGFCLN